MRRIAVVALAIMLPASMTGRGFGQGTPADASAAEFDDAKLEQIAAPVALYPDALLMQVFMAATYPLEVVEADRWIGKHALSGATLDEALKAKDWDPSVKSLCSVPDVLSRMSENLDWTCDMGDAFLGQQAQLLDAVQRLRGKAHEAGNLETTPQQNVTVQQDKIIVIQPSQPEVVYVPTYSPTVVYGTWPYPTTYYAPLYAPPPPGYGALAFATGVAVGAALWGDCHWGWGHSDVNINVNRYNNFNRTTNNNYNRVNNNKWQHNAAHRKGVSYRNPETARKFGAGQGSNRVSRRDARGFDRSRGGSSVGRNRSQGNRPATGRNNTRSSRQNKARGGNRSSTQRNRGGAYQGSRSPSHDRAASKRGSSSRSRGARGSGRSRSSGGRSAPKRSSGGRGRGRR